MSQTRRSRIEAYMVPIGEKIWAQRHLAAIRSGLTVTIPMTVIGGISCILAIPPVSPAVAGPDTYLHAFLLAWKAWADAHRSVLLLPYHLTIGIISVYAAAGVACQMAKSYHMDVINNVASVLLVLFCVSNVTDPVTGALSITCLGADYMFGAMVVALLVVEIDHFFIDRDMVIKLPDTVPPNIIAPFHLLIPLACNVTGALLLDRICMRYIGEGLTGSIFFLFRPLLKGIGSLPSVLLINLIATTFWFFGIHGTDMVGAVTVPAATAALTANMEAYAAGRPMPYIFAGYANSIFGNWITYNAILLAILTVCKSSRLRSVAKVAVVPSLFNINEPCIFGIPTVLNIYTFIPILLCNLVDYGTYHMLASAGVLGRFYMSLPFTVPGPIAAFLGTMDIKNAVWWAVLLGVDYLIVLPFIKIYDRQLTAKEDERPL